MTENKRFKFVCDDENCFFKDDDKVIDCLDVVDYLNQQEEVIKGYVESIKELQEEKDYWKKRCLLVEKNMVNYHQK